MARKPKIKRNAEQVMRQQQVRDTAKAKGKPSRDDIARVALWRFIHNTWKTEPEARKKLDIMRDSIVDDLIEQGFDLRESEERFEELAEKYRDDLKPFRIKRHLEKPKHLSSD